MQPYEPDDIDEAIAALLRAKGEEIASTWLAATAAAYPHSKMKNAPFEYRKAWALFEIEDLATMVLNGGGELPEFPCYWSDAITQAGPEVSPLANFLESRLFMAKMILPIIWHEFTADPVKTHKAVTRFECRVQELLLGSIAAFTAKYCVPGGLLKEMTYRAELTPSWSEGGVEEVPSQTSACTAPAESPADTQTRDDEERVFATLSSREVDVLGLLAMGETNGEIAARLNITQNTVKNHIGHIFDKLNMNNRTQLAVYAAREGLKPATKLVPRR